MGVNVEMLKNAISEKNTTLDAVAGVLKINRSTLYRKLRGQARGITLKEAQKISAYLGLSLEQTVSIFWSLYGAELCKRTS